MPDPLRELIRDTLFYVKDPLFPKQTLLVTAEEASFFQRPSPPSKPSLPADPVPEPKKPPALVPAPLKELLHKSDFSQIKKILLEMVPTIQLIDEIPADSSAKRVASAWTEKISNVDVILLACQKDADTLEFLKTLGKAIDQHLARAKILLAEKFEMENRWDLLVQKNTFRLVIASEGMLKLPKLMQFYKEFPARAQYFLDALPLLPLFPAALYKSVEHKALLWKTLCQMLKKH
jgi:hypothetical protein